MYIMHQVLILYTRIIDARGPMTQNWSRSHHGIPRTPPIIIIMYISKIIL